MVGVERAVPAKTCSLYLRRSPTRGARPFLLLSTLRTPRARRPTGGARRRSTPTSCRRSTSTRPSIREGGPCSATDACASAMRGRSAAASTIGIPPRRIGIMLGFQTGRGAGGREGLQPDGAWYEVVKWQALAARQVARERRDRDDLVVGLGRLTSAARDPDKEGAACVYLWARAPALCDAPGARGERFDVDREAGQIALAPRAALRARRRGIDGGPDRVRSSALTRRPRGGANGPARPHCVRARSAACRRAGGAGRRAGRDRGQLRGQPPRLPGGARAGRRDAWRSRAAILADELRRAAQLEARMRAAAPRRAR